MTSPSTGIFSPGRPPARPTARPGGRGTRRVTASKRPNHSPTTTTKSTVPKTTPSSVRTGRVNPPSGVVPPRAASGGAAGYPGTPPVTQLVAHVASLLFGDDQSAVAQTTQVVGGVGLAEPGYGGNLAHGERAGPQRLHNGEARGIGEPPEQLGLQRDGVGLGGHQHGWSSPKIHCQEPTASLILPTDYMII